jgi:hypothetical protein
MINLTITIDDIDNVLQVFNRVEIKRYNLTGIPDIPITLTDYVDVVGVDQISNNVDVSYVELVANYSQYYFTDPDGDADNWYISRYYDTGTAAESAWSDPVQGEAGDLMQVIAFPPEISYGTSDQRVIDRIRLLVGDPIGLNREYGSEAESSIHPDGRVYELDEKGWPAFINMYNIQYTTTANPTINGYKFLRFQEAIDTTITTISGIEYSTDLWYYTFRWSDREIMEVYDNVPPPSPLTTDQATPEIYMLQCAYDLLSSEAFENINEDGAMIKDEGSTYNPEPGIKARDEALKRLRKQLDDAIKSVRLLGIGGVLID